MNFINLKSWKKVIFSHLDARKRLHQRKSGVRLSVPMKPNPAFLRRGISV